jgi:hypothetical protein
MGNRYYWIDLVPSEDGHKAAWFFGTTDGSGKRVLWDNGELPLDLGARSSAGWAGELYRVTLEVLERQTSVLG